MMDSATNIDDLEDGEIESDGEETVNNQKEYLKKEQPGIDDVSQEKLEQIDSSYYSKSGKKKKSKSHKSEVKDKSKKSRKYSDQIEDDHAGKIEKAIRKALKKNDDEANDENDVEERRKHKKRKKYDKDGPSKKRKRQEASEDMDETEMMCVRGASPVQKQSFTPMDDLLDDDRGSYASYSSDDSGGHQHHRSQRNKPSQRERSKNKQTDRRRAHPKQDPDGVCLYFMQGKCHKGDDCIYSHDAHPPRKMELCKFYLMDCCAKRDKCLYMHADFPCKYYHTGLPCVYKDDCKFAHGKPLTENLKNILLKHIESAPKEILGDFPRLNREGALKMIQTTQTKLMMQYSENNDTQEKNIPSLFELNIPNPQNNSDFSYNNEKHQNKISPKVRQSRWQNESQNFNMSPQNPGNVNVLSIKNLTGVLTPRQISDLTKMGIDNLDQLGQLTVLQLNSIGISIKQITEIQLNTMSIQKLGLINSNMEQQSSSALPTMSSAKDLDLRVPPVLPVSSGVQVSTESLGKDVDMRFQTVLKQPAQEESSDKLIKKDIQSNKDMIDIDQYTKDALKFVAKDKENIDISNECFENEKPVITLEVKDVDHRVIPFSDDIPIHTNSIKANSSPKKEFDTDIRFLPPEPMFKSPEKKHRRSTTDDEDNNLLIDEKWYSSDEEKTTRKKSPTASPQHSSIRKSPTPGYIETSSVLSKLGDLSKIAISEEVTKLINSMKNNLQDTKSESSLEAINSITPQPTDPRSARRSPDKMSDSGKSNSIKKPPKVSIYECIDGEPTDGRRRTDVDLRQTDYKLPSFGDTDLRQSTSGDIDFRFGLPFKAIPNYTPASEIDGSINSHPPIPFKLVPIDIPRPDYTDIRNSTAKSQALLDPRLRKVFRLSLEESNSDSEKIPKSVVTAPRVDPRRKPKDSMESLQQDQKSNSIDIQTILQNSNWFRELSSTQKIFVNQHLAPVMQMIKQYQQDKTPGKKFDLTPIQSNGMLCTFFSNLGISLGENGEFSYLPKPKEGLLKTPLNFNQNTNPFAIIPQGSADPGNMNMMNMPPMGVGVAGINNMNVGRVGGHNFNQPFSDPRGGPPTPGLLGIAPNIPHNFNNNFANPNNFGNNLPFNNGSGQGNEFGFDSDPSFSRYVNRGGGHRGRGGNERWNRGGGARGNRDRKHFNDRGNWKN